jgi:hypothetical protein
MIRNGLITGIVCAVLCLGGCSGSMVQENGGSREDARSPEIDRHVKLVEDYNAKIPRSFSGTFTLLGNTGKEKIQASGSALYDSERSLMEIVFLDYFFKTPLTVMLQDKSRLYFYFPVDKKLFIDDQSTINIKNYYPIDISFNFIYQLMVGKIPMLRKYRVVKGVATQTPGEFFLIIENENFYETIAFKSGSVEKIKLMNKESREEFEVYFKRSMRDNEVNFFREIKLKGVTKKLTLSIEFTRVQLNVPVKVRTLSDLAIPAGVTRIEL